MRVNSAQVHGAGWLVVATCLFALAFAWNWDWAQNALGVAGVVALVMGMLHLAPKLSARLLAQIAVLRALITNQEMPDAKKIADQIVATFRPRPDGDSIQPENRDCGVRRSPSARR